MHNDNNKHSVRVAKRRFGFRSILVTGLLLSGVVCGAAYGVLAAENTIPLPAVKPLGFQLGLEPTRAAQTTSTSKTGTILPEDISGEESSSAGFKIISKAITAELRQGRPTYALKILESDPMAKKLKNSEFDRAKAMIAQSYLIEGVTDRAAKVAEESVKRSGKDVPLAGWVAGLAAWRTGDFGRAADMFALTAKSTKSSSWLASAGAYWAARSSSRAGRNDEAQMWYKKAAEYPRTFYGLVSLRTLGRNFDFNWDFPELTRDNKKALESDLKVTAALRLSRDGELSAAITTLGSTKWTKSDATRRVLLAYFQYKKDPAMTLYLARRTRDEDGRFYDTALYPESPWEPKDGYEVDKALIHALIRQESRFNPHAVSRTGAQGLMQIMPSTAQYISTNTTKSLSHPETNITVGQKYVKYLLKDKTVNNDLFNMAVAYNAGPGNLSRWKTELKEIGNDPMLFIESIPSGETRAFVERVMVNYWIYRMRMGQDVPSLDAVAALDSPSTVASARRPISDDVAFAE